MTAARTRLTLALVTLTAAATIAAQPAPSPATWPATSPATRPRPTLRTGDGPIPAPLATVSEPCVLIVSIDGCRPDCLLRAEMPTLRSLMARGSFTLWARTTDVAVTTPSHVSMLTGVTPERHGIDFNGDPPEDARIAVPTLFDLARSAGLGTGIASGKRKFSLFGRTDSIDWADVTREPASDDVSVGRGAARIVSEHRPRVMFVHFPGADNAGHGIGWGTPEQLDALAGIDRALAEVLGAYAAAGLSDRTYVIVSADHGGTGRNHGRDDMRSRYIPWILAGPGVRENFDLTRLGKDEQIATYDTFATACAILGLPSAADIDGKPVRMAFEGLDLMSATPTTSPASGPSVGTTRPAP